MKNPNTQSSSAHYRIKVKGILDRKWSEWFEGMAISYEDDATILEGPIADQAALHGLLVRIRDLNLTLQYLIRKEPGFEKKIKS